MAKFKVGDKVRILDVDSIDFGWKYFRNGDVTEVVSVTSHGKPYLKQTHTVVYPIGTASLVINKGEFHAIELVEDSANLSEEIYVLKRKVAELEERLTELEPEPTTEITLDTDKLGRAFSFHYKTQNYKRKEVIEKAKKFVEKTEREARSMFRNDEGNPTFRRKTTSPEFIVNEEKRTVVALVKGAYNRKLVEKGIAKCAPSDVFNVHIGKAIALGRAYGLPTSEFEQAPQPDEVVPGMVVRNLGCAGGSFKITAVKDGNFYIDEVGTKGRYFDGYYGEIISDSEAQY